VQDGTRQDDSFRRRQQAWYRDELQRRGWAYQELRGCLAERVSCVLDMLQHRAPQA